MAKKEKDSRGYLDFMALSVEDKRRLVAEDVLVQLAIGTYTAETGVYVDAEWASPTDYYQWDALVKPEISDDACVMFEVATYRRPCNICAIGAAAISAIALSGNLVDASTTEPHDVAAKIFTRRMRASMEAAFEQWVLSANGWPEKYFECENPINDFWYRDEWPDDEYENNAPSRLASIFYTIWTTGKFKPREKFIPDALRRFKQETRLILTPAAEQPA